MDAPDIVLSAFDGFINPNAPALVAVLQRSLVFAVVDKSANEVVIDRRALLMGALSVGVTDAARPTRGSTTGWLTQWVGHHVPDLASMSHWATTPPPMVSDAIRAGSRLVVSRSLRATVLPKARALAQATVKRNLIDLRHLVVALLDPPSTQDWSMLKWIPSDGDLTDFRRYLLGRLTANPERDESIPAWRKVLGVDEPLAQPWEPTAVPPATDAGETVTETDGGGATILDLTDTLSGFRADRPRGLEIEDPLKINGDVTAFAKLIAFSGTETPLSIGVFGGWGSGKSTFMERLENAVADQAEKAGPPHPGDRMLGKIVQIRFNAWHFADANLWASLTAEFFDQLRCGGYDKQGEAIHAQLVERVNAHVHDLSAAASQTKAAVADGDQKLVAAQRERDKAVGEVKGAVSQKLIDVLGRTYEAHKAEIGRIVGGANTDTAQNLGALVDAAKDASTLRGKAKIFGRTAAARPVWTAVWTTVILVGAWLGFGYASSVAKGARDFVELAGGLTAVGGAVGLIAPAYRLIRIVLNGVAGIEGELKVAKAEGLKKVLAADSLLKSATAEAAARHAAGDRAHQALSRYVDPEAPGNPPRLLRYMLNDDPDTRAMEKEVGLIGRSRRLFEAVDKIVEAERMSEKPNPDTPERIVLYIDDLDRCTYEQVYAVLQAVHLLLAFKLFVVVVAVDVNWVTEALANQFGRKLDVGAQAEPDGKAQAVQRQRTISYLEKIFQLPFWIRPLTSTKGADAYGDFVRALLKPVEAVAAEPGGAGAAGGARADPEVPGGARGGETTTGGVEPGGDDGGGDGPDVTTVPEIDVLTILQFNDREQAFLADPAIAAIAARTPRGVLRMANIYRIVQLGLAQANGSPPERPQWPLVALFAAVETSGEAEMADGLYEALKGLEAVDDVLRGPLANDKATRVALTRVLDTWPALRVALDLAGRTRGGEELAAGACLDAARAVRRYSFNKY